MGNNNSTVSMQEGAILCVVGARPNFMKIAPIIAAFRQAPLLPVSLLHTGQHYDAQMKESFFDQLGIPEPDVDLEVGSGSHAVQTAEIMRRFEPVIDQTSPRAVLVVGDVNSTIACALVASKKGVPVIHVEAGLRSFDRAMPEEINRVLTDQIADMLFTTEAAARENLLREGIDDERIFFVGNVMIDTLLENRKRAVPVMTTLRKYQGDPQVDIQAKRYAVCTLHRPSNVDDAAVLGSLLKVIGDISEKLPVVFTVHPRTRHGLDRYGLHELLAQFPNILCIPPVNYLEMLGLTAEACMVLTDSGGLQEETTALGVPCITLRENTERPITVEQGTNTIVGRDTLKIRAVVEDILQSGGKTGNIPELWDGKTAPRIRDHIYRWFHIGNSRVAVN